MMAYHLFKKSRVYSGRAYEGQTCDRAGVPSPAEFERLTDAMQAKEKMDKLNPVGFDIYNSTTGEKIYGSTTTTSS